MMIQTLLKTIAAILAAMLIIRSHQDNDTTKMYYWIVVCIYWITNVLLSVLQPNLPPYGLYAVSCKRVNP